MTDMSNAGCTGLLDAGSRSWFPLALDLFGIKEQWLPSLVPSSAVVGEMPKQILGATIPVAARAGDQQAASFAQAVHAEGDAKLTLGTAAMLNLNTANEARVGPPGTYALPLWELAVGECVFCLEGTVITAGAVVDWLVELEMLPEPAALDRVAGSVEHTDGVFFIPALQGLGTPLLDDGARGMWGWAHARIERRASCAGRSRGNRAPLYGCGGCTSRRDVHASRGRRSCPERPASSEDRGLHRLRDPPGGSNGNNGSRGGLSCALGR